MRRYIMRMSGLCPLCKFVLAALVILAAVPDSSAQIRPDGTWDPPDPAIKQLWFQKNTSDTAFVFVHGLNSDNTCWLYEEDGHAKQYWPYLVAVDERLHHPQCFWVVIILESTIMSLMRFLS